MFDDSVRIPLQIDLPLLEGEEVSAATATNLGYCLVTGGAGYLGRALVFELIRRGETVRVFDCREIDFSHERLDFVKGDLRSFEDVRKSCEGIDTVFHTAAHFNFLGFASKEQRDEIFAINVGGVENVARACREAGVKRLVHTSTNNVTFGDAVIDGDESLPYAARPKDLYTETKILGEQIALAANGKDGLLTCVIRPGGIYGPGDRLVLARLVEECARGRFVSTFGDGSAMSDNTFIDNLVDGEIEAAKHLAPGTPLCGQAYFITDGTPINYFDFFRPFVEGMGFAHPKLRLPVAPLYGLAWIWELLHRFLPIPPPLFTRLEVRKMTVSHYSRIDRARRDFGWYPKVGVEEANRRCISYGKELLTQWNQREREQRMQKNGPIGLWMPFPNVRWCLSMITTLHRFFYRSTGGRLGHAFGRTSFLLLSHLGRKSGCTYTTPLLYVGDDQRFVVTASNAGDDRFPDWWLNLQAKPRVTIQVGNRRVAVCARRASVDEYERLWPLLNESYCWFDNYRQRTHREIPVVVFDPI